MPSIFELMLDQAPCASWDTLGYSTLECPGVISVIFFWTMAQRFLICDWLVGTVSGLLVLLSEFGNATRAIPASCAPDMSCHLLFYSGLRHVQQKFGFAQRPFLLTLRHRRCLAVDSFHVLVSRKGSTPVDDTKVLDPVITHHLPHHCR